MLFPTSLVGSYPQPDWLIDRERLRHRFPPRVRARELWRVDPEDLAQAQDDATLLAIRAQEQAGLDILTDGEMRRESYSRTRSSSPPPSWTGCAIPVGSGPGSMPWPATNAATACAPVHWRPGPTRRTS